MANSFIKTLLSYKESLARIFAFDSMHKRLRARPHTRALRHMYECAHACMS